MRYEVINRQAALFLAAGYIIFGVTFGSLSGVSRLGIVFACLLFLNAAYRPAVVEGAALLYLFAFSYLGLTWLWSSGLTLEPIASLVTVSLGAVGLALSVAHGAVRLNELMWLLVLPAVANVIAGLLGIDLVFQLGDRDDWIDIHRFSGLVGNSNGLATICSLPLAVYLLVYYPAVKRGAAVHLFAICLGLAAYGLVVTGSRRSALLLAVLLPVVVKALATRWASTKIAASVTTVTIWLAVILALALGAGFLEDLPAIQRFDELESDEIGSSYELRQYMIDVGTRLFLERPIFGHGYGAFAQLSGLHLYSHNNFIEIAVNAGTLGLLLYYSAALLAFFRYARWPALGWLEVVSAGSVFLVFEMTGVSFQSRPEQLFLCLLLLATRMGLGGSVTGAAVAYRIPTRMAFKSWR